MHDDVQEFVSYSAAAAYIQDKVAVLRLQDASSSRWWAQVDRLADGFSRLVWFDISGVYHCTPWLSD